MISSGSKILESLINVLQSLDKMSIGAVLADSQNVILHINLTAAELAGINQKESIACAFYDAIKLSYCDGQTMLTPKSGITMYVEAETTRHELNGQGDIVYMTIISEKGSNCVIDKVLVASENNLRVILDSVYDAVIVHDLHGNIVDVNKKMLEMYGITEEESRIMTIIGDLSDTNNPVEDLPEIWDSVVQGENRFFEWKAKRPHDGSVFHVEVYLTRISLHHEDVILANVRDISEKKQAEQRISYLSFNDELTGLYNRAFFEKELIRLDTGRQLPISIIVADVNGLKLANDAFGHLVGDELLKAVAKALKKACRSEDIVSRWGGDEFAIILTNTTEEKAATICERIQAECGDSDFKAIPISVALGCASKTEEVQNISEAIKQAETNMYTNKLKEGKKNRRSIINSLLARQGEWDHNIDLMVELGEKLGEAYGIEDSKLEDIKLLVTIHDIGKVAIPASILSKPGPLDENEWEQIKKHSEIGYRIASIYPEYAQFADAILAHHERWDGKGYPRGLRQTSIPLVARLMAIIDAYDAMVHGRPYKAAVSTAEALEEIKKNAGTQFDPELAEIFTKIMK